MSQEFILSSFSNGHQIRREHQSLVGLEEDQSGMLSEMFNGLTNTAPSSELPGDHWYGNRSGGGMDGVLGDSSKNHNSNTNSGADTISQAHISDSAMQLFLMNPQQTRSVSSPIQQPQRQTTSSSTLHMLLPNPSSVQGFAAPATALDVINPWADPIHDHALVEGLSLSLSSSLQAKVEHLRMGDGGVLYYNQSGDGVNVSSSHHYHTYSKNLPVHVGFGSSLGVVNVLRSSKYVKPAQELLQEFCSVGRGHLKKNKLARNNNPSTSSVGGGASSSSLSKDVPPLLLLSAADRIEHQRRKVKLLSMLDEVDRRYNHYCQQMQMVVNSFDLVMGFGAAVPYTALAQKAMSRHFRCLKDAVGAQLKYSCELLGDKEGGAGGSGVTKGETPRLKLLEQSLRQQRAFHQMGIMEQEAWRPQRGLPERSVNILRAWLFEHFLHPYPSDADKHLLARQTGLSRNQVSNWFINARVRLWKPMVEDMYQQEAKEEDEAAPHDPSTQQQQPIRDQRYEAAAQTPTTTTRSEMSVPDIDPSLVAINALRHSNCFSENQAFPIADHALAPPTFPAVQGVGTTTAGDVSLTLGLRHAGNREDPSLLR